MTTDLELLQIEIETCWRVDERGRLFDGPFLVVGASRAGYAAAVGRQVPDALGADLRAVVANAPVGFDPAAPPPMLARGRELLRGVFGAVDVSSGPSYLFTDAVPYEPAAAIERSDGENADALRGVRPGDWEAREWNELLDGKHGPWAMATRDGRVVSICHTARNAERGVEAGTWTHEDFRGLGLAAAVTAAWSALVVPSGRHVFYSTSSTNRSSQRVAERLGLRSIGCLWQLAPTAPDAGG